MEVRGLAAQSSANLFDAQLAAILWPPSLSPCGLQFTFRSPLPPSFRCCLVFFLEHVVSLEKSLLFYFFLGANIIPPTLQCVVGMVEIMKEILMGRKNRVPENNVSLLPLLSGGRKLRGGWKEKEEIKK